MTTFTAAFSRDANRVPMTVDGFVAADSQTLVGTGAATVVPIFTITGMVECRALWGVVTTTLGSNVTAAYWRLNDATAQSDITLNTGTTLSSAAVGSDIVKTDLATAALVLLTSAQERVQEPGAKQTIFFSPFILNAKNAVTTNVEFVYSTNQNPTTGAIQFFLRWLPLSSDGMVTAL